MRARTFLLIVLVVGIAGGLAMMLRASLQSGGERAASPVAAKEPAGPPTRKVLVATQDLNTGAFLDTAVLAWREWPVEAVVDGHLTKGKAKPADLAGSVARHPIAQGDPVTAEKIVQPGERGFLAAVLTPGLRAVSVAVNEVSGSSGLIFPGDRVDLILTQSIDDEDGTAARRIAGETILRDVRVIAVGQNLSAPERGVDGELPVARTVTLEVTPTQAEKVAVARDLGSLALSLRSLPDQARTADARGAKGTPRVLGPTWAGDVSRALHAADPRNGLIVYRGSEVETQQQR